MYTYTYIYIYIYYILVCRCMCIYIYIYIHTHTFMKLQKHRSEIILLQSYSIHPFFEWYVERLMNLLEPELCPLNPPVPKQMQTEIRSVHTLGEPRVLVNMRKNVETHPQIIHQWGNHIYVSCRATSKNTCETPANRDQKGGMNQSRGIHLRSPRK